MCADLNITNQPGVVALFDFDGTICDDFREAMVIFNDLSDEFGFRKIEDFDAARDISTRELLRSLRISTYKLPVLLRRARQALQEKIKDLKPVAGIPEALQELSDRGVELGIVTSNSEENVREFLKNHRMEFFKYYSTGSSLFGKSRLIKVLVRKHNLRERASLFYVGDETRDVEAARHAHVGMIGVTWGFASESSLAKEEPDHLVSHPSELLKVIG